MNQKIIARTLTAVGATAILALGALVGVPYASAAATTAKVNECNAALPPRPVLTMPTVSEQETRTFTATEATIQIPNECDGAPYQLLVLSNGNALMDSTTGNLSKDAPVLTFTQPLHVDEMNGVYLAVGGKSYPTHYSWTLPGEEVVIHD